MYNFHFVCSPIFGTGHTKHAAKMFSSKITITKILNIVLIFTPASLKKVLWYKTQWLVCHNIGQALQMHNWPGFKALPFTTHNYLMLARWKSCLFYTGCTTQNSLVEFMIIYTAIVQGISKILGENVKMYIHNMWCIVLSRGTLPFHVSCFLLFLRCFSLVFFFLHSSYFCAFSFHSFFFFFLFFLILSLHCCFECNLQLLISKFCSWTKLTVTMYKCFIIMCTGSNKSSSLL